MFHCCSLCMEDYHAAGKKLQADTARLSTDHLRLTAHRSSELIPVVFITWPGFAIPGIGSMTNRGEQGTAWADLKIESMASKTRLKGWNQVDCACIICRAHNLWDLITIRQGCVENSQNLNEVPPVLFGFWGSDVPLLNRCRQLGWNARVGMLWDAVKKSKRKGLVHLWETEASAINTSKRKPINRFYVRNTLVYLVEL